MTAPLRVGLIGAGANTRDRHVPGFRAVEGVEVTGVVNRSRESSERAAAQLGVATVYDSVQALLADRSIDAVCIGTWPYRHREFTVAALEAGKHVLCEARMAMDAQEGLTMLRASEARSHLVAQLVPGPFDFRMGPTVTRLVRDGAIGELTEVTVSVQNGTGLDRSAPLHWRQRADYSGHNIMSLGIYAEILQRWLGPAVRLYASMRTVVTERVDAETGQPRAIDIPDSVTVVTELPSGARVTYAFSTVAAGAPYTGVVLHGTGGAIRWRPGDEAELSTTGGAFAALAPDPGTDRGWQVEADFVASIRDGTPVRLTSFKDGVDYMRFMDACWESARTGTAVAL